MKTNFRVAPFATHAGGASLFFRLTVPHKVDLARGDEVILRDAATDETTLTLMVRSRSWCPQHPDEVTIHLIAPAPAYDGDSHATDALSRAGWGPHTGS